MPAAVVGIMVAALAAGVALSLRTTTSLNALRTMGSEADQMTAAGQDLLIGLLDAESNTRAFLVHRQPIYLVPYATARVAVAATLGQLDAMAARLPAHAGEIAAIHSLADQRMALLATTLETIGVDGAEPGPAAQLSSAGLGTMHRAQVLIERLVRHASDERDRRSVQESEHEEVFSLTVLLAGIAAVLLLGTASLALWTGRSRLLNAQRALGEQAALWQATVENLQDGVAVFDAAGGLVQWNRNLARMTGFGPELLRPGVPFTRFVQAAADWQPPALGGAASPAGQATEVRAGALVLEVWRNAVPGGGQMLTIGDVTRRVDAEAIARQAQKMEVLGQLTGGVAHDFNNLLQVVSANLELIAGRTEGGEVPAAPWLRSRLLAAMEGVARGARLTRHLLAFARRQPLAPEPIDAGRLLTSLDDMLRRTLGPAVTLDLVVASGLWALRADAQQLENAILNLAINGRDAMTETPPHEAALVIEARNAALDASHCAADPELQPGHYVLIAVTDHGCGMTPEQLARAVEPFYTTKPEGQGTGLGLSMAYGFAKQSGGHLKLSSEVGRGTTARLYIPRTTAQPQPSPALPGRPQAAHGETVLLVEDDGAVRASAALALRGLGYRVEEAASADAGMALLEQGLRPQVLFTDVMMPGALSARTLAKRARSLVPGLAVVFTSGYTESSVLQNSQVEANVHLLSKPWRIEELAQRLRLAIDQSRLPMPDRLRILLVEDDALVRMITADMLIELGHDVIEASDADDALHKLDGVGLLITDIGLGETDGLTLAASARARRPDLPVIVASGQAQPSRGMEGLYWLTKPYDNAALDATLQRALQSTPTRAAAIGGAPTA